MSWVSLLPYSLITISLTSSYSKTDSYFRRPLLPSSVCPWVFLFIMSSRKSLRGPPSSPKKLKTCKRPCPSSSPAPHSRTFPRDLSRIEKRLKTILHTSPFAKEHVGRCLSDVWSHEMGIESRARKHITVSVSKFIGSISRTVSVQKEDLVPEKEQQLHT